MDFATALLVFLLLVLIVAVAFVGVRLNALARRNGEAPKDDQSLILLQRQINDLSKSLESRMGQTHQAVQQNFAASNSIVRDVTEKLTRMEETNKQVLDVTAQLQQLQDILKNPKQRGILGEYYLEALLQNVLPPGSYQMQYGFKDGVIVDAAVFVRDKIIPVDSKFSLENYNRLAETEGQAERERLERTFVNDLKERIKETAKYIRPDEGTMDFAFMFIPHEAIYYDLLINKIGAVQGDTMSILERAVGTYHVIIVSPTSFHAYLQTVLQGLRGMAIEEQAKEIKKRVADLGRHLSAYEERFTGVGRALGTAANQYELATKEFAKIEKDVLRVNGAPALAGGDGDAEA